MLRTNCKKAHDNIKKYIMNNFDPSNHTDTPPETWPEIATFILQTFRNEKYWCIQDRQYYKGNEQAAFMDWAAGLPSVLNTCYYYNRSAVDDLGMILEENDMEKARFTESDAERLLSNLIYKELRIGEKDNG